MERRQALTSAAFALPATLFMLLAFAIPLVQTVWQSVSDADTGAFTVAAYAKLLTPLVGRIALNTLKVVFLTTAVSVLLAYPLAFYLSLLPKRRRATYMIFIIIPFWTSVMVKSFAFTVILGQSGLINLALRAVGLPPAKLVFNDIGVIVGMCHHFVPFMVFPILANLVNQPPGLSAAAAVLGAGKWRTFVRVTLPLSLPGVAAGVLLCMTLSLGFYIVPALLGGRGDMMLANLVDFYARELVEWPTASALSVLLTLLAIAATPSIEVYGQGLYRHSTQDSVSAYPIAAPTNPTIPATNPFIPADLRTLIASQGAGGQVSLFKAFQETGPRVYRDAYETYQVLGGIRGNLFGDWKGDLYASHDHTSLEERISNVVLIARVQRLLSAPDGGNSICAGGYNPFGEAASSTISTACDNYITSSTRSLFDLSQNVVEANANGSLFDLPAGAVKLAVTASYRDNSINIRPDILLIPNYNYVGTVYSDLAGTSYPTGAASATNPISPSAGKITVKEIAGELLVPLFKDKPFAQSMNVTLGGRYSDYNLSGGVATYKAELDWRPVSMLLLRGGYEHAIRAPNVGEVFGQVGSTAALGSTPSGGDPCDIRSSARTGANGANVLALCQAQFQAAGLTAAQAGTVLTSYTYTNAVVQSRVTGSTALKPETGTTFTAGGVLSPRFNSGFVRRVSLSADYYNIRIKDAISTIAGALALSKCFNLDGSNATYNPASIYCSSISRAPTSGILVSVDAPYRNIGTLRTSGLDIQFDTEFAISSRISLGVNSVVSRLFDYKVQALPGAVSQDFAGTLSSSSASLPALPRWRALTTVTMGFDKASLALRWRFVDRMNDVSSVTSSTPAAGVSSYNVFDLYGRLPVQERFELRGGITNLANRRPPVVGGIPGQTNSTIYDYIGRTYFVGARVRF